MIGRGWADTAIRLACAPYCDKGAVDPDLEPLISGARRRWDKPGPDDAEGVTEVTPVDLWSKFEPPALPRGLLPDVIEKFAVERGLTMGGDPAGIAASALAVCCAAIPDHVKVQVKRSDPSWLESARIWVGLVGPPSSKKTPIMSATVKPLRRINDGLTRESKAALAAWSALSKDERAETPKPPLKQALLRDTTVEASQSLFADNPGGLLCYQDELTAWFQSMDRYSNGRGSGDRGYWLQTFNGGSYSVVRIGRGFIDIENLAMSLLGGIQPEPIRAILGDSADDGLVQRLFPIILKPGGVGRDEHKSTAWMDYDTMVDRLYRLGEFVLRFDDRAQAYRGELERRHVELTDSESVAPKLASHIGKYDGMFARLCVLWHCIEHCDRNPATTLPETISYETAKRAGDFLHRFFLPHALAFHVGMLGLSNDHDRLADIAGWILARGVTEVTIRDVVRSVRKMRNASQKDAEEVLTRLDGLGWLTRNGGTKPSWTVNPAAHTMFADRAKAEDARRKAVRKIILSMTGKAQ